MSGFNQIKKEIKREHEFVPQPTEEKVVAGNPFDEPAPRGVNMTGMYRSQGRGGMLIQGYMQQPTLLMGSRGPPPGPPTLGAQRVYPSDQPLIFSSTNPNAPPIFACGQCHMEIHENDQAIQCESGCNFWFHRVCTGLSEDALKMLNEEPCAEWTCDNCWMQKSVPLVKFKP